MRSYIPFLIFFLVNCKQTGLVPGYMSAYQSALNCQACIVYFDELIESQHDNHVKDYPKGTKATE